VGGFVVGAVVGTVVGAGVAERIGTSALCQVAAIFRSPVVFGWIPSAWLSATPSYPAARSTTVTGEAAVESSAARFGRAALNGAICCAFRVASAVGMIFATRTRTFGFFCRRSPTIDLTFARRVASGTCVIASFVPAWSRTMSGVGDAASQTASGERGAPPTIMDVVYPPCPSCCWSKTNFENPDESEPTKSTL
jgi:hypothetical protein